MPGRKALNVLAAWLVAAGIALAWYIGFTDGQKNPPAKMRGIIFEKNGTVSTNRNFQPRSCTAEEEAPGAQLWCKQIICRGSGGGILIAGWGCHYDYDKPGAAPAVAR